MFLGLSVCLFVCLSVRLFVYLLDYSKSYEQIFIKFFEGVGRGPRTGQVIRFRWLSGSLVLEEVCAVSVPLVIVVVVVVVVVVIIIRNAFCGARYLSACGLP